MTSSDSPRARSRPTAASAGHRGADDVPDVRMRFQGVLDQLELHLLAGVAVLRLDDLDVGSGDRFLEALVARLDPAGARRAREPGDLDLAGAHGMRLRDVLARLVAHLAEGDERLGGKLGRRHAVDHVDHRDALGPDLGDEIVQAVEGNRADHDGIRPAGDAVLDLRDLGVEVGIATRFDELHLDPEALRLGDDPVVDGQPVGVFHVRKRNADVPGLRGLLQGDVVDRPARAGHVERRVPYLDRVGIPLLRRACPGRQSERQREHSGRRGQRSPAALRFRAVPLHGSVLPVAVLNGSEGHRPIPGRDRQMPWAHRGRRDAQGGGDPSSAGNHAKSRAVRKIE